MVDDFKVIQIALSEPSNAVKKLMGNIRERVNSYKLITDWSPEHKEFYNDIPDGSGWHWLRADVIRFEYLSRFKNVLYLDWDVSFTTVPKLNDSIYWAYGHDYWAIYNSDKLDVFKKILERGIQDVSKYPGWRRIKRIWLIPHIIRAEGNVFPRNCFKHKGI
jgi:hypothetical protein